MDSQINYLILLPDEHGDGAAVGFSILHGFSRSLLMRSGWIRQIIAHCPPTAIEAFQFSPKALQLRLSGISYYSITPLLGAELQHVRADPLNPFWVLLCDDETVMRATEWAMNQPLPILVVERPAGPTETGVVNAQSIQDHIRRVCKNLNNIGIATPFDELVSSRFIRPSFKAQRGFAGHNLTMPNELLLLSVGAVFSTNMQGLAGPDERHVERIIESADEAATLRGEVPDGDIFRVSPPMPTIILTCPGMYKHATKLRPPKGLEGKAFFRMLRLLQKQQTYSIECDNEAEMRLLLADPSSQRLLQERTLESSAYTDAVSVRAASYLCPVLRLPPAANKAHSEVIALANCLRGSRPTTRKVASVVKKLSERLHQAIAPEILRRIDQPHVAVKLIADAPLEWLSIRGLPLALRHVTSRIPATPGNLSFSQTLPRDQTELTRESFSTTLVVRSFKEGDPLRNDLEIAIRTYRPTDGSDMPVQFVDVGSRSELVEAVNRFDGALLVYDGHGRHESGNDIATLSLADEEVNCWDLRHDIRCPPIVFVCGCDTHAIGGSHVTSGNGFLVCGAQSVIATALPIHSQVAAIFAARLLFNVYEFLCRVISSQQMSFRWDYVFSTVQRMMFVSELLRLISRYDQTFQRWGNDVQPEATLAMLNRDYDWYEQLLRSLAARSSLNIEAIESLRTAESPFPECLKYFHLGNPDTIVIRPTKLEPISP